MRLRDFALNCHTAILPSLNCIERCCAIAPKIIDFGVAKATNQRLTDMTMVTALGQMVGTPEYMSPEQASMIEDDIDTRTDVYALGVVLYEQTGQTAKADRYLTYAGE